MLETISDEEILTIVYDALNSRYCEAVRVAETLGETNKHLRREYQQKAEKLKRQKTEVLKRLIDLQFESPLK